MIQKKSSMIIQNALPKMHSMILRSARFSPKQLESHCSKLGGVSEVSPILSKNN